MASVGLPLIGSPSKVTTPAWAGTSPMMALNSVVFPAPLGPTMVTSSPGVTRNPTPRRAWTRP